MLLIFYLRRLTVLGLKNRERRKHLSQSQATLKKYLLIKNEAIYEKFFKMPNLSNLGSVF